MATLLNPEADNNCELVCGEELENFQNGITGDGDPATASEPERLRFLTHTRGWWTQAIADAYEEKMQGAVKVEIVQIDPADLFPNIINEAQSQIGLYDGYFTGPAVTGSVVEYNGFADLTGYISETAERTEQWADMLLGYRQWVAQYQDKILMFPLDGDIFSMYYRRDILEAFDLPIPRTWEEYAEVAEATHGKTFDGKVLTGSCVGRSINCAGAYWANLVIASLTQTNGAWQGHLFDTADMKPLTGIVLEEALRLLELQVKYGPPEEFDKCIAVNLNNMIQEGNCVLTYNWGNSFKRYLEEGSVLRGRYGVAPTPGSTKVLDRETMELVPCDKERCGLGGTFYEDIGWVNNAPYMAFGGWACAVNNYTDTRSKRLAIEFCDFASSKEESIKAIIPNATGEGIGQGQDPFRRSHLDLERYVEAGYEPETTEQFIGAILSGMESPNVVTDIRFPTSTELYSVLDKEYFDYLNSTAKGLIPEADRPSRRRQVSASIDRQWGDIISKYDSQGSTKLPVLEAYQRLRNVYQPDVDKNQLEGIRIYGYALVGLIFLFSLGFGFWSVRYRSSQIVRASQPFFLVMICVGTIVLGATIIPLGIDDGTHSVDACSKACMAVPWLLALGWSIVFSALFSKLWRVNIVYRHSMRFRRLKVSEKDVLLPFVIIFSANLFLLIIWTVLDPLAWSRNETSPISSYGTCSAPSSSTVWKVMLSCLGAVNGAALILANVEAYKARRITTEYGESKHIAMIMGSVLQVILVGVPLLFLVDDNPTASYFIRASIVFVICISILFLIFVPKVITWWKKKEARKMTKSQSQATGLRFQVYDNPTVVAERAKKLDDYREKVAALEEIMIERGYEAEALFKEVGLNESTMDRPGAYRASSQEFSRISQSQERAPSSQVVSVDNDANILADKKTAEETVLSEDLKDSTVTDEGGDAAPNARQVTFSEGHSDMSAMGVWGAADALDSQEIMFTPAPAPVSAPAPAPEQVAPPTAVSHVQDVPEPAYVAPWGPLPTGATSPPPSPVVEAAPPSPVAAPVPVEAIPPPPASTPVDAASSHAQDNDIPAIPRTPS